VSASAAVAALDTAFAPPLAQGFLVLAPLLSVAGARVQFPLLARTSPTCAGAPVAFIAPLSGPRVAGTWPDSSAGRVFAYDSATQRYRGTADSSGPVAGVRFLLYLTDSLRPLFPLFALGRLDLSASGPDSLHGLIADQAATLVDYRIAIAGTQRSYYQILAGGFAGNGRVFTFRDSTNRSGGTITVSATVDDSAAGTRVTLLASRTVLDQFDNFYSLDFSYSHGTETVRLKGNRDTYCQLTSIGLTVTVNDGSFASVTNGVSATAPNVSRADGQPLTAAQLAAVLDLIRGQNEIFDWLTALSWPGALTLVP
jgi:hypothetical protein